MSNLEKFTMMTPKSVQIGYIPGGCGGLTSVDIANACHDLPNYIFKLMVAKYCFAERDTSKDKEAHVLEAIHKISVSLIKSGDIKDPDEAGRTAKAICYQFISANRCQGCGGRGEVRRYESCRNIIKCPDCDGTGHYVTRSQNRLYDILLSGLYEYESRAGDKLKHRLK